jgi:hypothetical protein
LKLASCSGLPDGICFQTKNSNLGKFSRALDWKKWIYFMAIGNILRTFGIFYDHLVHFVFIWYFLSGFGIMREEKSGNPGLDRRKESGNNGGLGASKSHLHFSFILSDDHN